MAIFDKLAFASFKKIEFPTKSLRVVGGIREHIHEYPHSPGGAPEKLGRKLYEITITADFTAGLLADRYKDLWPQSLGKLRAFFEQQLTGDLVIPTIGPIKAYAVSWEQTMTAGNRSGEEVQMVFREDASDTFLILDSIKLNPGSIQSKLDTFKYEASLLIAARVAKKADTALEAARADEIDSPQSQHTVGLLTRIADLGASVVAIGDQSDLYGSLLTAQVDALVSACREADSSVTDFDKPANFAAMQALHDLWASAQKLQQDVQNQNDFLRTFTVPVRMGIGQVASALFGDASKGGDLMRLNVLSDPLSIEPGTQIRYYQAAA